MLRADHLDRVYHMAQFLFSKIKNAVLAYLTLLVFSFDLFNIGLIESEAFHGVQFSGVVSGNARVIGC